MEVTLRKYFATVLVPQHILSIAAIVHLFATGQMVWLIATFVAWFLFYVVGEGIVLHRYYSHKSYDCNENIAKIFSLFALMGGFGTPIGYRGIHIMHHQHSDTERDPHSPHAPNKSWWHGYMGWYLSPLATDSSILVYSRHLLRDPFYPFVEKHRIKLWWAFAVVIGLISWELLIYTMGLAGLIGYHMTNITTSFSHGIGSRRFDTADKSTNMWWWSWFCWQGSGALQNNHHAKPARYHDSHAWYELDVGKWLIPLFAKKINYPDA